jgi:hypothetical protein
MSLIPMMSFSITLVNNGKSEYSIVRSKNASGHEQSACIVLQNYLEQISGVFIPIIEDNNPESEFEILIGNTNRNKLNENVQIDGFLITIISNKLIISGKEKGTLYGVYTFLEKYLGCRKYSSGFKQIPTQASIILDEINDLQNPQLNFRSLHYWDAETDQEYLDWHKLNRIEEKWGLWGHSFFKLVSPVRYFDKNPEYFSLVNGERKAMQLCLTNPDVLEIVVSELGKRINETSDLKYWSVSQNDDIGACECEKCVALNNKYESYQGSLLTFVNQIAARFPEKIISTLAYNFSRKPPKGLKPRENVNIMFSSIDINRSKPVDTDPRSQKFRGEYDEWDKLTSNIIVWDYVVQFTNYISPFPNLHTLKPNFDYFSKNQPEGFFIQGSVEVPGELAELRTYILSKLLWDKDSDIDQIKSEFLNSYYGRAGVFVGRYIELIHENVISSWRRMDIYDNPIIPYQNYLSPNLLKDYLSILDTAETLVSGDVELTKRVQMVKLPLHFAALQQARFFGIDRLGVFEKQNKKWEVRSGLKNELQFFIEKLKELQITQLNESGLSPEQYYTEWIKIFEDGPLIHKANDKPIRLLTENTPEFVSKGARTLVDGIGGTNDFQYNWLGWNETDMKVEIDMETPAIINNLEMSFLENHRHYMFLPREIRIELSNDGNNYKQVGSMIIEGPFEGVSAQIRKFKFDLEKVRTRYLKITAFNQIDLPAWRMRKDRKPWLMIDEIIIK